MGRVAGASCGGNLNTLFRTDISVTTGRSANNRYYEARRDQRHTYAAKCEGIMGML